MNEELVIDQLYGIIDSFRKNPFSERFGSSEICARLRYFVESDAPILFIFPGFHGKINNPDFVLGECADMGDYVGLTTLRSLIDQIGAVYAPGARLNIVHECHFYVGRSPLIGTEDQANQYLASFRSLIALDRNITSYSIYDLLPIGRPLPELLEVFQSRCVPSIEEVVGLLQEPNHLNLYKAYKKINSIYLERDAAFRGLSKKERQQRTKALALGQMQIYFGFGKLIRDFFGKMVYIRLSSLYKPPQCADCVAINYLPNTHHMSTPTFHCAVRYKDGSWDFIRKHVAEQRHYVLSEERGLKYFREE